jgi:hypothetical protein
MPQTRADTGLDIQCTHGYPLLRMMTYDQWKTDIGPWPDAEDEAQCTVCDGWAPDRRIRKPAPFVCPACGATDDVED